jgi:hypothetical protein
MELLLRSPLNRGGKSKNDFQNRVDRMCFIDKVYLIEQKHVFDAYLIQGKKKDFQNRVGRMCFIDKVYLAAVRTQGASS